MKSLPYVLLLGCDGIRSIVRNAFVTNHREFEFDLKGTFIIYKSIHITRPDDVKEGQFMLLAQCLTNMNAFVLPETGGKLNFACGHPLNQPCDPELLSDDPSVVGAYFQKHFKGFNINDDEVGKEWVAHSWVSTQQVHANFYHSLKLRALLMGDAAHATLPQIGQGMNTALADAAVLDELLDEYNDDLDAVLPVFSKERVKEGNALTDLSFYTFSLSWPTQIAILIRQNVRRWLNGVFPAWLVEPEPMIEISRGTKLSVAYDKMMKLGYMKKVRHVNDEIMQYHFEKMTGMIIEEPIPLWRSSFHALLLIGAIAGAFNYSKRSYID
jgi:kynurenine 3-monooxygenase